MGDLDWPEAFDRTPESELTTCPNGFRVTRSAAFENILDEMQTWDGVTDVQLDSGAEHQTRNPNKPYARASFDDPGVVVYFTKDGESMAAACDRWDNPRDNAQDLYHYLHETRMLEQRGTVTAESEYEKLRLPSGNGEAIATEEPAHEILEVAPDADESVVKAAYREKVKSAHPDAGGSTSELKRIRRARELMLE